MRSECAAHSDSEAQVTVRCTGEMLLILPTENRELEMGCWRQNVIRSCRTSRLSESILPNMLPGAQIREERACGVQGERTPECHCGGELATWQAGACCYGKRPHDFETGQTTEHGSEIKAVIQMRMREATSD